jgi:hypothetical protein
MTAKTATTIRTIDAAAALRINEEVKAALAAVLGPLGLDVKLTKNVRDREGNYTTVSVVLTVKAEDGAVAKTPEAKAYEMVAPTEGLAPEWLGKTFTHPTMGEMHITGFRMKARKAPVIVKHPASGKEYIFAVDAIRNLAKRAGWELPERLEDKWAREAAERRAAQTATPEATAVRAAARGAVAAAVGTLTHVPVPAGFTLSPAE